MKLQTEIKVVDDFIQQFRQFGTDVVDCFSYGMCFHFSLILYNRFQYNARQVYDPIANHFAVEIFGRIWDIAGDITDNKEYKWVYWDEYSYIEPREVERIRRDCFYKVPSDLLICRVCGHCLENEFGCVLCGLDNKPVNLDAPCEKGLTRE